MTQSKNQTLSFYYLLTILVLIWVVGIEKGLFFATIACVLLTLLTWLPWAKKLPDHMRPHVKEITELAGILLVVWLVRSFIFQPYRIPTGSLEPTAKPGDFILVEQWAYGLRIPVFHQKIFGENWQPKRGDIALFYWPKNPAIVFVKRIVGLPGDTISYQNKQLLINGKFIAQTNQTLVNHLDEQANAQTLIQAKEQLPGSSHAIYLNPSRPSETPQTWVVPEHAYFAMGDNRDNSEDSRYWGFVPDHLLIGQAKWVWMSWNPTAWAQHDYAHLIRFNRIGHSLS